MQRGAALRFGWLREKWTEEKSGREKHCKLRTKGKERGEGRNRQNKRISLSRDSSRRTIMKKREKRESCDNSRKKEAVTFDLKPTHSLTSPRVSHHTAAVAAFF